MRTEFDQYITDYRKNNDKALWLSGETSDYFAQYKAKKLACMFPELHKKDGISILDFGCGDGLMANHVSKVFNQAHVWGADSSQKSIDEAKKTFNHISFVTNDENSTQLPFAHEMFDLIYAAGTLHHIPFSMHEGYVSEFKRVLKKDGVIVIFEINPLNPLSVWTFKHNPIDVHAAMLMPWYAYRLAKRYGNASISFICFFPKPMKMFRVLESWMTKIPIGALYAVCIE